MNRLVSLLLLSLSVEKVQERWEFVAGLTTVTIFAIGIATLCTWFGWLSWESSGGFALTISLCTAVSWLRYARLKRRVDSGRYGTSQAEAEYLAEKIGNHRETDGGAASKPPSLYSRKVLRVARRIVGKRRGRQALLLPGIQITAVLFILCVLGPVSYFIAPHIAEFTGWTEQTLLLCMSGALLLGSVWGAALTRRSRKEE